jgi:hypothetical protein
MTIILEGVGGDEGSGSDDDDAASANRLALSACLVRLAAMSSQSVAVRFLTSVLTSSPRRHSTPWAIP